MKVTFNKIENTITIHYNDGITEQFNNKEIPSSKISDLIRDSNESILAEIIDIIGSVNRSLIVDEYNECCNSCCYKDSSICNGLNCTGISFLKIPNELDDPITSIKNGIKDKLCNKDICPYYGDCDNASICILKVIMS